MSLRLGENGPYHLALLVDHVGVVLVHDAHHGGGAPGWWLLSCVLHHVDLHPLLLRGARVAMVDVPLVTTAVPLQIKIRVINIRLRSYCAKVKTTSLPDEFTENPIYSSH